MARFIIPGFNEDVAAPTLNTSPDLPITKDDIPKVKDTGLVTFKDIVSNAVKTNDTVSVLESGELEPGVEIPFSPQWRLADQIGTGLVKGIRYIGNVLGKAKATKNMLPSQVHKIDDASSDTLRGWNDTLSSVGKYGDEVLGYKGVDVAPSNFFDRQKYFTSRVPEIERDIRAKTRELIPGAKDLDNDIFEAVQKAYSTMDDKVKTAYQKVEDAGDPSVMYDGKPMVEDILTTLRDENYPEPVIRSIKRNLFYQERNLTPAEKGAQSRLPALDDAFDQASLDLKLLVPSAKDNRKNLLKEAEKRVSELQATPAKNRNGTELNELKAALTDFRKAKTSKDDVESILPDFGQINEQDFIRLIREINRKKFVGGGDISKYDQAEQNGLSKAKRMVEDYFEKATSTTNPTIAPLFKQARSTYREKLSKFGPQNRGTEFFPELGKLVKKPYGEGQDIDATKQIDSLLKSPRKIEHIGKILDEQSPGSTNKMVDEWLYRRLGTIKQGDRELLDFGRTDLNGLQTQLDDIVSDDRALDFISKTKGPEAADGLSDLHGLVSSMNKATKDITKKGTSEFSSEGEFIDAGTGMVDKFGRTIKIIKDSLSKTDIAGNIDTQMINQTKVYIDRVLKARTLAERVRAIEMLQTFTDKAFDGTKGFGILQPHSNTNGVGTVVDNKSPASLIGTRGTGSKLPIGSYQFKKFN